MFDRLREKISRKWIVSVLLVCFAFVATAGGIRYYEFRQRQKAVQNPAYQTALGILSLERYPKLALDREQAEKLLPIARKLAAAKGIPADGSKQAQEMQIVLNPEQKEYVVNSVGIMRQPRGGAWSAGVRGLSVEKNVYDRDFGNKRGRGSRDWKGAGKGGRRFSGREDLYGRHGAGAYGLLLEMLMQKVYG